MALKWASPAGGQYRLTLLLAFCFAMDPSAASTKEGIIGEPPPATSASQGSVDQEIPPNPGSQGHPTGCQKPCNKFEVGRLDSCKHGMTCQFCHADHEKPKHRGQRGRHALQRRQYMETRTQQPDWLRELIDKVYRVPHEVVEGIKKHLLDVQALPIKESKTREVLKKLRDIGEEAQLKRPDSSRFRGKKEGEEEDPGPTLDPMTELDGRCKWLVGTLHLMVRKIYDHHKDEAEEEVKNLLQELVRRILDKVHQLESCIDEGPPKVKVVIWNFISGANITDLSLTREDTIDDVKQKLLQKASIPVEEQRLSFKDDLCIDGTQKLSELLESGATGSTELGELRLTLFRSTQLSLPDTLHQVRQHIEVLVIRGQADSAHRERVEKQLHEFNEQWLERMEPAERKDQLHLLQNCKSLDKLLESLKENEVLERLKNRILSEDLLALEEALPPEDSPVTYTIKWAGGEVKIVELKGDIPAGDLRDEVANQLEQEFAACLSRVTERRVPLPKPRVRLGVEGLICELDYRRPVPKAVQTHLRAVLMEERLANVLQTLWPADTETPLSSAAARDKLVAAFERHRAIATGDPPCTEEQQADLCNFKEELERLFPSLAARHEGNATVATALLHFVGTPAAHQRLRFELPDEIARLSGRINAVVLKKLEEGIAPNKLRERLDDMRIKVDILFSHQPAPGSPDLLQKLMSLEGAASLEEFAAVLDDELRTM